MEIKGIYVITSEDFDFDRTHEQVAQAAVDGGASIVQLRDKTSDDRRVLQAAISIRRITLQAGAIFIVNNRVDIALASQADGVNLGQSDMPIAYARKLLGQDKIIGISAEIEEQVREAQEAGADYVGFGPIYSTSTKLDAGPATGLEMLRKVSSMGIPVVAIGGIDKSNIKEVAAAGADSISVVSAVAAADDMLAATKKLVELFHR